jgi:mRNA interferase MazF
VNLPYKSSGLRRDWKAQAEHVRSVAVQRVGRPVGRVPADIMGQPDKALRLHLAL